MGLFNPGEGLRECEFGVLHASEGLQKDTESARKIMQASKDSTR